MRDFRLQFDGAALALPAAPAREICALGDGDAALLYIPHGEAGQRRMIAALMALRPADAENPELDRLMAELSGIEDKQRG